VKSRNRKQGRIVESGRKDESILDVSKSEWCFASQKLSGQDGTKVMRIKLAKTMNWDQA